MLERFTQKARTVVVHAQQEAREFGAAEVRTEHLLAAMLAAGSGQAYEVLTGAGVTVEGVRSEAIRLGGAQGGGQGRGLGADDAEALRSIGIDLEAVQESVENSFGPGALSNPAVAPKTGRLPFTKEAKKTLELALREAIALHHDYIGTEHLLLGLVRQRDTLGYRILVSSGVDPDGIGDTVKRRVSAGPARKPGPLARLFGRNRAGDGSATGDDPATRGGPGARHGRDDEQPDGGRAA